MLFFQGEKEPGTEKQKRLISILGTHKSLNDGENKKKWRPQGDSNPCRRRERAVSWTGLDDGDATSFLIWWAVLGSNQ